MVLDFKKGKNLLNNSGGNTRNKEIREIFVHSVNPGPNDWGGSSSWPMTILDNTQGCYFIVKIPEDFKTLLEAVIVILPDTTETIQWDWEIELARKGELENVRTNNDLNVQQAVILDTITELSLLKTTGGNPDGLIPKGFIKQNDYIGLWFESDTNNIQVLGLRLKYST